MPAGVRRPKDNPRAFYNQLSAEQKSSIKNKLMENRGVNKEHYHRITVNGPNVSESWDLSDKQVIGLGLLAGLLMLAINCLLGTGIYAWTMRCMRKKAE